MATKEYILRFYRWGPAAHEDLVNSPRFGDGGSLGATPIPNMAIQAELTHLRAKRDRLRQEVAEKDEQLVDQRQLQRELAQARAQLQRQIVTALEVHAHPRIDTSTKPSPGTGPFHGDGRLHLGHVRRPI
ncbi:hypothetical protein CRG98_015114 [Punica granatum]|uniref:Uncharacterized protein n=1 Tax=Punica granatum TaxID=22663 RepID=A0A2I0K7H7_PUNGR|nr:hypothetical protein CRG98_015114 [Punica granatum]